MKRSLFPLALLVFFSLFPIAASAQSPLVGHYFIPEYYSTVEEAVGRLKNIQPMLMGAQDGTLRSVEADRFGIRFFWTAGQATVIPFDKLSRMRIFHNTVFEGPCPWFVAAKVSEEGEPPLVRTATKEAARELYSIIASLSAAAGNPLDLRGNLGGSSDTPTKEALKNAGLKKQAGVVVNLVEMGGAVGKGRAEGGGYHPFHQRPCHRILRAFREDNLAISRSFVRMVRSCIHEKRQKRVGENQDHAGGSTPCSPEEPLFREGACCRKWRKGTSEAGIRAAEPHHERKVGPEGTDRRGRSRDQAWRPRRGDEDAGRGHYPFLQRESGAVGGRFFSPSLGGGEQLPSPEEREGNHRWHQYRYGIFLSLQIPAVLREVF